jgi:hypothetical protein
LHRFRKERRSPRSCFECGDTTHFIADCPKRKKFDSSNKCNYNNRNDSSDKCEGKKKYRFGDRNKKKKLQKMMSRACAALSDLDLVMTPLAPRRMRDPSARRVTSLAFASWTSRRDTSLTLTPM